MKKLKNLFCIAFFSASAMVASAQQQYNEGVFILNEDWFGHNNSTLNFLNTKTGEFDYLIVQEANTPEKLSLGCTAQFATIYGDNLYVISKQNQDSGESTFTGGRIVVADSKTMKIKKTIPTIFSINGKSAADGRAFVGVDESKGYIGTSNGIFIMDLTTFEITGRIEGSENPLVTGNESNADGNGPLYNNQIGLMIRTHDHVFAIQQDKGILVIDPKTDKIETVINGCFSTLTQSKDGNIWVASNSNQDYLKYPYGLIGEKWNGDKLLKINPETLETENIDITSGGVNQTWYAWTAGSLCASKHQNALYFTYNSNKWSWFTTSEMYKYDIDKATFTKIFDSAVDNRYFYGGGIRVNPLDDKIYATLYKDNNDRSYWIYQMDNDGNVAREFEPIQRYWFPALVVFPDNLAPVVSEFEPVYLNNTSSSLIDLSQMATDQDNMEAAITKTIVSVSDGRIKAKIKGNSLEIESETAEIKDATVTVRFNSNGKTADRKLHINPTSCPPSSISETPTETIKVYTKAGSIVIEGLLETSKIEVFNTQGRLLHSEIMSDDSGINNLTSGQVYIVKIGNKNYKIIL